MSSPDELYQRIDALGEQYQRTKHAYNEALAELKQALVEVAHTRVDGELLSRSELIKRSGLSRQAVYNILAAAQDES